MKVLHKYVGLRKLDPVKGDLINEACFGNAIAGFADYCFGTSFLPTDPSFDLVYIRANTSAFHVAADKARVYVASPYDEACFARADVLATFSEAWAEDLRNGVKIPGLNPNGRAFPNAMNVGQVVGDQFVPQWGRAYTDRVVGAFSGSVGLIGHFGRVVKSNSPQPLFEVFDSVCATVAGRLGVPAKDSIRMLFGLTSKLSMKTPKHLSVYKFTHEEVPYALSACTCVFMGNRTIEYDICGSLKCLEAASCGTPPVLGRSRAREEVLGKDYPYFVEWDSKAPKFTHLDKKDLKRVLVDVFLDVAKRVQVSADLVKRSQAWKAEQAGLRIKCVFEEALRRRNNGS